MEQKLTPKQSALYKYIQQFIESHQLPPSLREIGKHFGVSVGTVQEQVKALCRKGFLKKEDMRARGLQLPMSASQIPILGRVHAGPLHAAIENVEGHVPVGAAFSPSKHFALRVRGDSMIGEGILNGDLVLVRVQSVAQEGDIVVARVDDETTVKRLTKKAGRYLLEAANPRYPAIDGPFEVVGIVVEVRRQYGQRRA